VKAVPSLKSLTRRERVAEVMDQPGIDPGEHALALAGLRRINAISRCSASLFAPIRQLAERQRGTSLRVLDLACGGGDTAIDLALMARRARQLVLVNDLIRSPLGYGLAWAGTRLLSRSWIVHTDGPRSVQGAFQLAEVAAMAERAGLRGASLRRCWPER
jgi:SAM-dependent methyltransferase